MKTVSRAVEAQATVAPDEGAISVVPMGRGALAYNWVNVLLVARQLSMTADDVMTYFTALDVDALVAALYGHTLDGVKMETIKIA